MKAQEFLKDNYEEEVDREIVKGIRIQECWDNLIIDNTMEFEELRAIHFKNSYLNIVNLINLPKLEHVYFTNSTIETLVISGCPKLKNSHDLGGNNYVKCFISNDIQLANVQVPAKK